MNVIDINKNPFVKIVIPFILGIYLGSELFVSISCLAIACVLSVSLLFILNIIKVKGLEKLFDLYIISTILLLGMLYVCVRYQQNTTYKELYKAKYLATLSDRPYIKKDNIVCKLEIEKTISEPEVRDINQKFIAYFPKDSALLQLSAGDKLVIETQFYEYKKPNSLSEFNYNDYLINKSIRGSIYIAKGKYEVVGRLNDGLSIRDIALRCRQYIFDYYKKLGFCGDELAVLSALTLGDKKLLSQDIKDRYSLSGASHILALSGMHIAFLAMIIAMLLYPINRYLRYGRYISFVLAISLIFFFSIMVGGSASVLRSSVMFMLVAVSRLLHRDAFSLNNLSIAAFILLLIDPLMLFDIGFQLSFLSILSIYIFYEPIVNIVKIKSRILRFIWSFFSVCISVQILIIPFTIYYFNGFSLISVLTNIVVIPALFLILLLSAVLFLVSFSSVLQEFVASLLQVVIKLLNSVLHTIENLPFVYADGVYISKLTLVLIVFALLSFGLYLRVRKAKYFICFLVGVLFAFSNISFHKHSVLMKGRRIAFYNNRNVDSIHLISESNNSVLFSNSDEETAKRELKYYSGFWAKEGIREPLFLSESDDFEGLGVAKRGLMIDFFGTKIAFVNNIDDESQEPICVDYLYVSSNFCGDVSTLLRIYKAKNIIIHSAVLKSVKDRLRSECSKLNSSLMMLSEKGDLYIAI